jgi:putative endonuclease
MTDWLVYILVCSDGTYYTGITNNLEKRVAKHNSGKGAKYTKTRRPVTILTCRTGFSRSEAMKLERKVKSQKRSNKVEYLENFSAL